MTSHAKTYTNGYIYIYIYIYVLFVVRLGLSRRSENYSAVRTTAVTIRNSKLFSFSNSGGFPYGQGNPIRFSFGVALDLPNCHTFVTEHLFLFAYIAKVLLYRCQDVPDICRFFYFQRTKIDEQDAKTELRSIVKLPLEHACCSLPCSHQAKNVTVSTKPVSNLQPTDKSYCYKTDENNN